MELPSPAPVLPAGDPAAAWDQPGVTPRYQRGRLATKAMTRVLDLEMRPVFLETARTGADALHWQGAEQSCRGCGIRHQGMVLQGCCSGIGSICCLGACWICRHVELVQNSPVK